MRTPPIEARGRRAFVALGSNAVAAPACLERALRALQDAGERIASVAHPRRTPYEEAGGEVRVDVPAVLNSVVELRTEREPRALLDLLLEIEGAEGRERGDDDAVRTLDLDLLDVGVERAEADLALPHPRALDRAFVLAPWEDLAPLHVITGTGRSVVAHAARLRGRRPEAFRAAHTAPPLVLPDPAPGRRPAVLEDARALDAWRAGWPAGAAVGVVPTMGALHAGHEALLRRARAECDAVLATLFVNPLQFGEGEDLGRYPRTWEADLELLGRAGADAVYAPDPEDLYGAGFATYVEPQGPARGFEGDRRPGHFRGVATVVYKLWRRTRPDRAYFGRKDAQQIAVLARMAEDLELGGVLVACPTVRETDGLALSSRNRYLAPAERARALGLSRALETMVFSAARGERAAEALKVEGTRILREADLDVEYLDIVDAETMTPRGDCTGMPALAVGAVRLGTTRLLDNRWVVVA